MKIYLRIILLALLFLSNSCSENIDDKIVATVGKHEITLRKFKEKYDKYLSSTGIKDNIVSRRFILNNIVNEILLFHYDDNKSIFENLEYQKELKWIEKQAELAYLKEKEVYEKLTVTDEELRVAFSRQNQKLAVRHLYAPTEDEANKLYDLLQVGVSFDELAKQAFNDSTLKNNGGYLGYFEWGELDPNFEEGAYNLQVGEISKPVETEQGFSIIKLEDRVAKPIVTEYEYQNNKNKLERAVKIYKKRPAEKAFVNSVVDLNKVKINEEAAEQIFEKFKSDGFNNLENSVSEKIDDLNIIEYDGTDYSTKNIIDRINALPYYHRKKINSLEKLNIVLKGFVLQDALLKISEQNGYDENEFVAKTLSKMKSNLFMRYKNLEVTKNYTLHDSVVYNFYKEYPAFFSTHDELNVQEIVTYDKSTADLVRKKLRNGGNFGELAQKYSKREFSAVNNGELGFTPLSKFGNLKKTLWNADLNKVLGPIMIDDYYGIFKVLGKKESRQLDFDEIKEEATYTAKYFVQNEIFKDYTDSVRNKLNNVKINDKLLTSYKSMATS